MKKLILALFVGLLASCTPQEYVAKDKNGNPILIKDGEGVIDDAIKLGVDSLSVIQFDNDGYFTPLRSIHKDETVFRSDTLSSGKKIYWSVTYRTVHLNNMIAR